MKLVVGLGNPGPRYETTRHNAGFLAIDRLIDRWNARGPDQKHKAEIFQADVRGEKVVLMKPMTFMNLSGQSVAPVYKFHKLQPADLIVIHDEVDLPPVTIRVKTGGGNAGHNGLRSIFSTLGKEHNDYHRIRIGVGRSDQIPMDKHVLQPFTDHELQDLDKLLDQVAEATELLLENRAKRL